MRVSEIVVVAYLAYLLVVAWLVRLPIRSRLTLTIVVVIDTAWIWWLSRHDNVWTIVRDWQPIVQILIGYWLSGLFFRAPMPRVETWLSNGDRWFFDRLGLDAAIAHAPRLALETLELAYLSVYFVLPLG